MSRTSTFFNDLQEKFGDLISPINFYFGKKLKEVRFKRKCKICLNEAEVSYSQVNNYLNGSSSPVCKSCTGKINEKNPGRFVKGHNSWNTGIRGEKAHTWKLIKKKKPDYLFNWIEYKNLKKEALSRDEYCCTLCGSTKKLEMDHIKPRYLYPELTLDINNVRILCNSCHKKTETYGAKVRKMVR